MRESVPENIKTWGQRGDSARSQGTCQVLQKGIWAMQRCTCFSIARHLTRKAGISLLGNYGKTYFHSRLMYCVWAKGIEEDSYHTAWCHITEDSCVVISTVDWNLIPLYFMNKLCYLAYCVTLLLPKHVLRTQHSPSGITETQPKYWTKPMEWLNIETQKPFE
jgi:hypothetical protein